MKKIAFLITSKGWGGLEMNTIKLAKQFIQLKYEVSFISAKGTRTHNEAKAVFEKIITIEKPKKHFDFKGARILSGFLKKENIQNVFLTNNRDIEFISLAKRFFYKDLKIVYQQQMQVGVNKKDFIHTLRYKSLHAWISPLKYLKKEVLEKTRIPEEKIKVIPLAIDVNYFANRLYNRKEALQKLNLPDFNEPVIGIIGRIDPQKGQLFVIKAINELNKKNVKIQLLVFGSPTINEKEGEEYYEEMKNYVSTNNMGKYVHFREYTKDIKLFYDSVDIFAMASLSEAFGMVTLEAMASGVVVIGGNKGGTPEILANGKFGLVYELNNVAEFCEKTEWVLFHPQEVKAMTELAKEEVFKNYDERKVAEKIAELF
ncbi:MAG: glycosyltransferase family 4 protein [Ginsengibacter sp.]